MYFVRLLNILRLWWILSTIQLFQVGLLPIDTVPSVRPVELSTPAPHSLPSSTSRLIPSQLLSEPMFSYPIFSTLGIWLNRFSWQSQTAMADSALAPPFTITVDRRSNPCASETPPITTLSAEGATPGCTGRWLLEMDHPLPIDRVWQVRLNQQIVAETPRRSQADTIVRQLRRWLQSPSFDPHQLRLVRVNRQPTIQIGEQRLIQITRQTAQQLDRHPDLVVITWFNTLRAAIGQPKLGISEAQQQLDQLVATPERVSGKASWYGPGFHGRITAAGEVYDQSDLTAAHPSLPFDTYLKVTNQLTGHSIVVRINDRGPYWDNRTLDLSLEAARCLNSETVGVVSYEAVVLQAAANE